MFHFINKRTALSSLCCALLVGAALTGCRQESKADLLAQARQYRQNNEFNAALISLKNAVEANPDHAEARFLLATLYNDTGNALAAEKEIRKALANGTPAATAMPVLAKALLQQGQFKKALEETEAEAANNGADLLCVRADAHLALEQVPEAKKVFEKVLELHPDHPTALIGLGRVAFLSGDVDLAHQYATRVLAAQPRNTDALMFKGDLLRAQNQPQQALDAYDQVIAINPQHRTVHVEMAYLEIAVGKFAEAQANLAKAEKVTPGSVLVAYTQALLDFSRGKHIAAQESLQKVLRVAPDHPPSVLLAGAVALNLGSLQQAEHHLRRYLDRNPYNVYARKMLASTLLRSGATPDALAVLEPALKSEQQDVQLLALAGESYMQARDFNKATEYFGKASELDPTAAKLRTSLGMSKLGKGDRAQGISDLQAAARLDTSSEQAGIALIRAELGLQRLDQAHAAVEALEKTQPANATLQDLKGMVYLGKQDPARARAAFERALALEPAYFPAAANLAQLDAVEKKPEAARQRLKNFLANNKGSVEALNALATLATAERKPDEATRWLEQAHEVDANAIGPAVRLLSHYLVNARNDKALLLARKVQLDHPDNPDLLDLLGKSQLANGDKVGALDSYKKLAAALPRSAHAQMQVAAMELLLDNTAAAEDHLKTALAMQPDFPAAQVAQAELYVKRGSYELAMMMADRLQRKYPKASAGYQLAGDVRTVQNKHELALAAYEQALALGKKNELVVKIANALRATGKPQEAVRRLDQWLKANPDDARIELYKAETMLADKQYAEAAPYLEAMLKRHPDNVTALNNLAWAYQQMKDRRARAVAEQAYQLAGDQPAVMDTLGWILIEQGDTARGLPILQKAHAQAPLARDIRYHLAAGLAKAGQKPAARQHLEQLLAGDTRFAQADDARALLLLLR
ncbi:XrtA/PEP-CTERM system TPR-repeat protein PrsT [Pseudoduganella namucuonensis]|uniref:Putative PEP-CTERM system TPR-repeat lipoprotein n=1 Tax=Pseudoduganella namucuonensis TaxID=1035707 RepID=A0A1I7GXK6_9BURK|nr:XrtA/PEP-CTERM system TPR-repeat protein PrsT [Pseudoduganella namucuonensis]SFU53016.1 putative PEP-CTERM system TPR-repeat lipoprotein [Pseudoduganella namucuonensis]